MRAMTAVSINRITAIVIPIIAPVQRENEWLEVDDEDVVETVALDTSNAAVV